MLICVHSIYIKGFQTFSFYMPLYIFMVKYESFQLKLFLGTLLDPLGKNKKTHRDPNRGMWTTSQKNLTYNRDSFSYGDKTFSEKQI